MVPAEVWGGLFLLILGMLIVVGSFRLSLGSLPEPGPGLFPALLGLCLAVLAVLLLLRRNHSSAVAPATTPAEHRQIVALFVGLTVYPAFLDHAGYLLTTFATMLFVARTTGMRSWFRSGQFAAVATVASYVIFATLLGARLPFGNWLR